jgi:hypothetical protein
MNDKIRQLQDEIEREKRKISNCRHNFGEAFFNPETVREPYGFRVTGRGSDMWSEPEGYNDVKKDRWTRVCKTCGKEEHTNKQKPVITNYKPDFN